MMRGLDRGIIIAEAPVDPHKIRVARPGSLLFFLIACDHSSPSLIL